jgi:hypothetical protein
MMMSLFFEAEAEEDKAQTVVAASEPSRTARQRWKAELGTVCGATAAASAALLLLRKTLLP